MFSHGITMEDLGYLCMIRQGDSLARTIEAGKIEEYLSKGYIERLKNGGIRMTPRGGSLMTLIETPGLTPEIEDIRDRAISLYNNFDKETGVLKEVEKRLCWFVSSTGFKMRPIIDAITFHLETRGDYTMRLDNLIWKPGNVFQARMSLSESTLFDIIARKYGLNSNMYLKENRNKEMEWMFAVSRLPEPPARGDKDIFISGSSKGDKESILRIKNILGKILKKNQ